ncbi:MAG: hypothetical protein EZS28_017252, partial [Streblomastix strix]
MSENRWDFWTRWATRRWIWGRHWSLIRKRRFRTDQSIEQKHGEQLAQTDGLRRETEQCGKMEMRRRGWIVCVDGKRNKEETTEHLLLLGRIHCL